VQDFELTEGNFLSDEVYVEFFVFRAPVMNGVAAYVD